MFAHLQKRDEPAPRSSVPTQERSEDVQVPVNTVTVTEGSIYFEESRAAKLASQGVSTPAEYEPQPTPQSEVPRAEDEPVRVLADNESPEPVVVRKSAKKKKKTKVSAGAPGGGVMYFDPAQYQATVNENTQEVSVT